MARRKKVSAAGIDLPGLCRAMVQSRYQLKYLREERVRMVRQYAGKHVAEDGARNPVPVNLLALYVNIVGRKLVANDPRVQLTTFNRAARPVVHALETYVNEQMKRLDLGAAAERVVLDALFGLGVMKVGLGSPADAAASGWRLQAGEAFAAPVDLDDLVFDPHARRLEEADFIGHRYRCPLDVIKDSKLFTKARKRLEATPDNPHNLTGDERVGMITRGYQAGIEQEWGAYVDLWEIYLPRHRLIVTLADDWLSGPDEMGSDEGLRVQPWLGPENGPYHPLTFLPIPGSPVPKAPLQDLIDLHEAQNRTFRKIMRTLDRVKEITGVRSDKAEEGTRVLQADDGDMIKLDDPQNVTQWVSGGKSLQALTAGATLFKDEFSYMAGNLDIAGGLSPQSRTAHQDEMLNQNQSATLASMQNDTVKWMASVCEALVWFEHHHPAKHQVARHRIGEFSIQRHVSPQDRQQIPWRDLAVQVDPYSLQHQTPPQRLSNMMTVLERVVLPMMPVAQQQGIMLDLHAVLQKIAEFQNDPGLLDCLTIREPIQPQGGDGGGEAPGMPANTTRTYNRTSSSAQTQQGTGRNQVTALLGKDTGGSPTKAE